MSIIHYKHCPLCDSERITKTMNVKDHSISGETFDLFKCQNCGFTFTQDIPDQAHIGDYYKSEDYISHSDTQKGIINKLYHKARSIMLDRKYRLIQSQVKGNRLLDYGTGTGYFLQYMSTKGYEAQGVEIDADARKFIEDKFGLQVIEPAQFLKKNDKEIYDAISMWHVLEHVEDPDSLLKKMHQLLDHNGKLFIAVPNHISKDAKAYKEYWAAYDVPRHLWHFEPKTMQLMAKKNGFKVESLHRLPFDPYYNSLLSAKYKKLAFSFFRGGVSGLLSSIKSWGDIEKSSSLIYVLSKA
jgi:2-polyprenyl-3-methyl-5-hydroxy-6-metoxy-1,4-benzoquinol methylase